MSMASSLLHLSITPATGNTKRRPRIHASADRQALFSRIAPVYDNLNDLLSLGQHRIWKRMAVDWSGAKEGGNVLDLCCGSGDLAFLLSQKVGVNGQVIGYDFSREQLTAASSRQELSSKACYRNLKWVEGDALDLPFPDCHFDAITMGYGLRNVIDKYKALKEVYRVLKPGSKASILDFNKSTDQFRTSIQGWMIENIVVPVAAIYGLSQEYRYLKSSIQEFLTCWFLLLNSRIYGPKSSLPELIRLVPIFCRFLNSGIFKVQATIIKHLCHFLGIKCT